MSTMSLTCSNVLEARARLVSFVSSNQFRQNGIVSVPAQRTVREPLGSFVQRQLSSERTCMLERLTSEVNACRKD